MQLQAACMLPRGTVRGVIVRRSPMVVVPIGPGNSLYRRADWLTARWTSNYGSERRMALGKGGRMRERLYNGYTQLAR